MRNSGYYSGFGGAYIPEILVATFDELEDAFEGARSDPSFWESYERLMASYCGRATPLTLAENLSERFGGARIYIKREDLNHTGAHKANNVMGQGLLVKRMGKTRVIAETGAGQHGVATATMAARFGLQCTIYMGEVDIARQRPNVFWMERLGATVIPVRDGSPAARGTNVVVHVPGEESLFDDASEPAPGVFCTSPIMTYLDLWNGGDREREASEHLAYEWFPWLK